MPDSNVLTPTPQDDILRFALPDEDAANQQMVHARLIARVVDALGKMDSLGIQRVAQFVDICCNNHGCDTPAERFIVDVVRTHSLNGLTPDDVQGDLDEFRQDFADAVRITKRFNRLYAGVIQEAPDAE